MSSSLGTRTVAFNKENVRNTLWFVAIAITIPTLCLWVVDLYRDIQELRHARSEAGRAIRTHSRSSKLQQTWRRKIYREVRFSKVWDFSIWGKTHAIFGGIDLLLQDLEKLNAKRER